MKELLEMMVKDYQKEGFTRREWMIGAMAAMGIVAVCLMAEWIWTL